MLVFLNAYGLIIGIASGILGFIAFFESRHHPVFRRSGSVAGIVALVLCLMVLPASLVAQLQSSSESARLGTTPAATSSNPQSETTIVPTQAQATPTPSPTPAPSPTPSPTPTIPRLKPSYSGTTTWTFLGLDSFQEVWYVNSQDQKGNINITIIISSSPGHYLDNGQYFCTGTITSAGRILLSGQDSQGRTLKFDGLHYPDGHIEGAETINYHDYQDVLK